MLAQVDAVRNGERVQLVQRDRAAALKHLRVARQVNGAVAADKAGKVLKEGVALGAVLADAAVAKEETKVRPLKRRSEKGGKRGEIDRQMTKKGE